MRFQNLYAIGLLVLMVGAVAGYIFAAGPRQALLPDPYNIPRYPYTIPSSIVRPGDDGRWLSEGTTCFRTQAHSEAVLEWYGRELTRLGWGRVSNPNLAAHRGGLRFTYFQLGTRRRPEHFDTVDLWAETELDDETVICVELRRN